MEWVFPVLITREMDYAIRILRALTNGRRMTTAELSAQHMIPQQFAHKIIKKLERADLVEVLRGANGGCMLKADLSQTTLFDLVAAAGSDNNSQITACLVPGFHCSWQATYKKCNVHCHLAEIQDKLEGILKSYTLEQIFKDDTGCDVM